MDRPPAMAIRFASIYLALVGVLAVFYAPIAPLLPPLVPQPVPVVLAAIGIAGIVAGVGVWLGRSWGRWLGLAMVAWRVALAVGSLSGIGLSSDALDVIPQVIVAGAWATLDVATAWILLRRWPVGEP